MKYIELIIAGDVMVGVAKLKNTREFLPSQGSPQEVRLVFKYLQLINY
jgi:hypothetical protein